MKHESFKIQAEKVRVLVAFADISRFGSYAKIASRDPDQFRTDILHLYREFVSFKKRTRHIVKFLGDGLMAIAILGRGHNCELTRQFLSDLAILNDAMNSTIDAMVVYPKPVGFRTRVVAGQVSRIKTEGGDVDYIGYAVNLASRLLRVQEGMKLICHESVKDIIGNKIGVEFKKVKVPHHDVDGVDFEDLDGLWEFKCLTK